MSDQDIFDKDDEQNKDEDLITNKDDIKTDDKTDNDQLLAKIVNEDGTPKYKSISEALAAAEHAQKHIKTLESDNSALKEKGSASDKLDELLDAVKQSQVSGKDKDDVSAISTDDVLGIVKNYLKDNKAAETKTDNINAVVKVFKDRFGKDASDKLYEKADDLGLSRTEINGMIANNPNAALKVLGVEGKVVDKADMVTTPSGIDAAQFRGTPETKPDSVMNTGSSKDLLDAWNASKARTNKRLGIEA